MEFSLDCFRSLEQNVLGHLSKMAATPIYGKTYFKRDQVSASGPSGPLVL